MAALSFSSLGGPAVALDRREFERILYADGASPETVAAAWEVAFGAAARISRDLAEVGRRSLEHRRAGAEAANRKRAPKVARKRAEVVRLAVVRLAKPPPDRHAHWTVPMLATEVVFAWRQGKAPAIRTVERHLRVAIAAGRLVIPPAVVRQRASA